MENKNIGKKIQIFCIKYLNLVIAILTAIIGIFSIILTAYFENAAYNFTSEKTAYRFDNIFIIIGLFIIALAAIWGCNKLADKIKAKYCITIGEEEIRNKVAKIKLMSTGEEETVGLSVEDIISKLS